MDKIAIVVIILFVLSGCGGIQATRAQPNILIVVLDALRADHVGCYGYERNTTPNLDAFARESVLYRNAYATCSWTKPSVTSILTGLTCEAHGVQKAMDNLSASTPYLPAECKARGYATAIFMANTFIYPEGGYARGCDRFWQFVPDFEWQAWLDGPVEIDDAVVVNRAIPWVRETRAPWFAYVHLIGPHTPYEEPARVWEFGDEPIDDYDEKLRYADAQLGRLLAAVPKDTIVIITSDHGEEFGEHGGLWHGRTLYDEVLRVPLLIHWPGETPRIEHGLIGLDRLRSALLDGRLPDTGGEVQCDLKATERRVVTTADVLIDDAPAVDLDALRKEQLEALGYF